MNLEEILPVFVAESRELLSDIESHLLGLDSSQVDEETLNAIFRTMHTIKGSAGLFQLDHIVAFAHVVESLLDALRDGRAMFDADLVSLLLTCCDHVSAQVDIVAAGRQDADPELEQAGVPVLEQLRHYLGTPPARVAKDSAVVEPAPVQQALARVDEAQVASDCWHISLRFGPDVLRNGMDPLSFIRYLTKFGSIVGIATIPDAIPAPANFDPETCYLGFEIAFQSSADKSVIDGVFDFVREDSTIRILPPNSRMSEYVRLIEQLPEDVARLGEMLVGCGSLTQNELEAALASQHAVQPAAPPLGTILVEQGVVQPSLVEAALAKQQRVREVKAREIRSIRVDADKLDELINLVGELVIASASTDIVARRARVTEVQECTATLTTLVQAVRDQALRLRMVRIGETFNRFQRVVYDVSRELGKEIELVLSGEETELDKTVVERITDPLTHLIRNALDHGIESAEVRRESGKPVRGTVRMNAYHDSGNIVIEVRDDGAGLRRDKILAKAIQRKLIPADAVLSDRDIYALIFEPGFSTADQVTNLSGRGVGMDVVKRNIIALRGSVEVESEPGVGTTVVVRLPLTLAIIDGFLVSVGASMFVLPLDSVEECVEFSSAPGHDFTDLRGQVLPFVRLRELFQIQGASQQRENIVVVKHAGRRTGLVVDSLLGEFQTVIKPLGKLFQHVKCISGSSILGTGDVALILDVPSLVQRAN